MENVDNFAGTYGALLLGGLFSASLSGVVLVQAVVYFKLFPIDESAVKWLVASVCFLDFVHSGLVWSGIWTDLISHSKTITKSDYIPLTIALSVLFTAILTFCVHMFFARRIYRLSQKNWVITVPIIFLAFARLVCASVSSAEMIRLQSFQHFMHHSGWIFTLGLGLSSAVDVLVTLSLLVLLKKGRSHSLGLSQLIDSLILYTIEVGSLTCTATIISMICWLTMSDNLVFLGLHFVIGKLYANSMLASLISRRHLRLSHERMSQGLMNFSALMQRGDLQLRFLATLTTPDNSNSHVPQIQISACEKTSQIQEENRS